LRGGPPGGHRAHLDLVEPAYIRFDEDGRGELVFGALQAGLECEAGTSIIFFDFEGSDEMTPIRGDGTAELAEDGSLELEISIHHDDEVHLKARRWSFFSCRRNSPTKGKLQETKKFEFPLNTLAVG
jgi:hypothetical protein